jgi:aspartate racemase
LRSAADELVGRGAEVLIIACTELSVIADAVDVDVKLYDSSQVLAETIVRMAKG